jgi:formamidopyrimidine-DNA glycosylase
VPELPEVEVLRRSLEPHLIGKLIRGVEVRNPALRERVDRRALIRLAAGRRVRALRRRGKYLWIDLDNGSTVVVHLGMSGRLTLAPARAPVEPHEHVALLLGRQRLRFRDPRRFGVFFARRTDALERDPHFARLGLEPLAPGFDGTTLARAARGRRGPIKSFLMDASVVVGIGNIYASEALYRSGIHPARSVARISSSRFERLAAAVVAVLEQAIEEGGTTLNDFTNGEGEEGYFQVSLRAYGREGEPCRQCGARIRRTVQAGRSTYYCAHCQR